MKTNLLDGWPLNGEHTLRWENLGATTWWFLVGVVLAAYCLQVLFLEGYRLMHLDLHFLRGLKSLQPAWQLIRNVRGGVPTWEIIVSICFFPIGLLALLAGRKPTECPKCQHIWQA